MKNKILVPILIGLICFISIACKKDQATLVSSKIKSAYANDSTGLHFSANVVGGTSILWDTITSTITHGEVRLGSLRTKGNAYRTKFFRIQNSDGTSLLFSYDIVRFNGGGWAQLSGDVWNVHLSGKEYWLKHVNGTAITSTNFNGTINHNGRIYNHFKGEIALYNFNSNNQIIDSLKLSNVDWVYTRD
jgi:hypothetical protein